MSQLKYHFFVCTNARPPFAKPSCGQSDAHLLLASLQEEADKRGLLGQVKITACACLGPCEEGPVMVVYPAGVWYKNVSTADIPEIVESHMMRGQAVERLQFQIDENV